MNIVPKSEFIAFIRANPQLTGVPIEGYQIAIMQYTDDSGKIVASAFYGKIDSASVTTYRLAN